MATEFTKEELQHAMTIMSGWGEPGDCEVCNSVRKKLEAMIIERETKEAAKAVPTDNGNGDVSAAG
jgi:hypothetical protein